jgi:citrate synthase
VADGYVSGEEAAALLGVKRQTLYAYASRGLVRSRPSAEGRAHAYARDDLLRLKARSDARAGHGPVAASALRWGEPVLETAVSTIDERGPIYRGQPAVELAARGVPFERAAELLWGEPVLRGEHANTWSASMAGFPVARLAGLFPEGATPLAVLLAGVPAIGARDAERGLVPASGWTGRGRALVRQMAALLCLPGRRERFAEALAESSVARSVLVAFGVRPAATAVRAVDRALVLCADHELNPSTFGVRVAASAGADLYACLTAGLAVLSGPEHGGVCDRVEALVEEARRAAKAGDFVARRAQRGEPIPGFGHPVYRSGDPRTPPLFEAAAEAAPHGERLATVRAIVKAMAAAGHEPPTLDMGLVAVAAALGLPPGGAAALFAIGRTAGWIAHAAEQRAAGFLVRPRARYTGPATTRPLGFAAGQVTLHPAFFEPLPEEVSSRTRSS